MRADPWKLEVGKPHFVNGGVVAVYMHTATVSERRRILKRIADAATAHWGAESEIQMHMVHLPARGPDASDPFPERGVIGLMPA